MMKKQTRRTALAVLLLIMTLISVTVLPVGALSDYTPSRFEPYNVDGYKVFYYGGSISNNGYIASINSHIAYHGENAYLLFRPVRTDETQKEYSLSLCTAGWRCTLYTLTADEYFVPLSEVHTIEFLQETIDKPWSIQRGDNLSSYEIRIYVPNEYSSMAVNPFTSLFADLPKGLKTSFNGFMFNPDGQIKPVASVGLTWLLILIAVSLAVTIFKLILDNLNVFRRKK